MSIIYHRVEYFFIDYWYLASHQLGNSDVFTTYSKEHILAEGHHYFPLIIWFLTYISLKQVTEHPYLGVVIDSKISFSAHIDHVIFKATRMLNFIRHNLCKCNKEVKCMAYLSLVRPSLEYASSPWDPYLIKDLIAIKKFRDMQLVGWQPTMTGEMVSALHQHLLILDGPPFLIEDKYSNNGCSTKPCISSQL